VLRFWSKVAFTDGCWEWQASIRKRDGYGRFQTGATTQETAHRFSYALANGPIPQGMFVCHRCDNPRCVRPDHLFLGTPDDNMQDKTRKGRQAKGSEISKRLRPEDVLLIRTMYASGNYSQQELADSFGVYQTTISHIIRRSNWKTLC
jgi:hypothetical protein